MPLLVESQHVSGLAVKIISGWSIPEHAPETVTEFTWAKGDMSACVMELRVERDVLSLKWDEADGFSRVTDDAEHKDLFGKPFRGRLVSGWTFAADAGMFKSHRIVEGHYWSMSDPTHEPVVWVTELRGLDHVRDLAVSGNLSILARQVEPDGSRQTLVRTGHRFQGAYTYYLVSNPSAHGDPDRWFLIVDSGGSRPIRRDLFNDVLALQFVLGTAFYFDVLEGLGDGQRSVARIGGRYGRDHRHRPRTEDVVPTRFVQEHWAATFFEAISTTYRERPGLRLDIALSFYLDGLASFHVEGRYLLQHVGLEAFAYWLLKEEEGTEEPALIDKPKWKAWLKENKDTIRSLAVPGSEETLYSKVTSIPARRASSMVVEVAFQRFGLSIVPEMADELENGRNVVVHTAVMFEERREDVNDYLMRIAIVRTMLTALLAKIVGYKGAILGWEREYRRPYKEADAEWWTIDPAAREAALRFFNIEGTLPAELPEA